MLKDCLLKEIKELRKLRKNEHNKGKASIKMLKVELCLCAVQLRYLDGRSLNYTTEVASRGLQRSRAKRCTEPPSRFCKTRSEVIWVMLKEFQCRNKRKP